MRIKCFCVKTSIFTRSKCVKLTADRIYFVCKMCIRDSITAVAGGRGGGKPDMAQGGGSDASKIDDALAKVDEIIAEQIK